MAIKVVMEKHNRGSVFVDGVALRGVRSVRASVGVGEVSRVEVEFIAHEVEIDFDPEVERRVRAPLPEVEVV
jgi:hypothetical protein